MVAVHVAEPERIGHVGEKFLAEQEAGGGGAAIEEQAGFLGLDQDAGMLAPGTGVPVSRAEEDGAHGANVATFRADRQSKLAVGRD